MDMSKIVRLLWLAGVRIELNGVGDAATVRVYSSKIVAAATPKTGVHGVPDRDSSAATDAIEFEISTFVEDAIGVLGVVVSIDVCPLADDAM